MHPLGLDANAVAAWWDGAVQLEELPELIGDGAVATGGDGEKLQGLAFAPDGRGRVRDPRAAGAHGIPGRTSV
jgi:hypothetical protein